MWLVVMFDLPTDTSEARKAYAEFRKFLLKDGFVMMQFSIYKRYCSSRDNGDAHANRVARNLPKDGEVRILAVTEKQFENMLIFCGKRRGRSERAPEQLMLF